MSTGSLEQCMAVLRKLEQTSSSTEKSSIIEQAVRVVPFFRDTLFLALNPYMTYGFKKLPFLESITPIQSYTDEAAQEQVKLLCQDLSNRALTGDQATHAVKVCASQLSRPARFLLGRILLKDLRCGVGATLVNKAVKHILVPEFEVMLASPYSEKVHNRLAKKTELYTQPKLDGDRLVVFVRANGETEARSRGGHLLHNFKHIEKACHEMWHASSGDKRCAGGMVFDGEIIKDEDFFSTRTIKRKEGNQAEGVLFHIFDCVKLSEWGGQTTLFGGRRNLLKFMFHNFQHKLLKRVLTKPLASSADWAEVEKRHREAVEKRYEGLMIRLDASYNFNTRSSLYKFKTMLTDDYIIHEILPGETGKKHEHHAGSIVVDLGDGNYCKAGLKLSDEERDHMWKARNKLVGMVAEIQFQGFTRPIKGQIKLQFPVFVRVRKDKS